MPFFTMIYFDFKFYAKDTQISDRSDRSVALNYSYVWLLLFCRINITTVDLRVQEYIYQINSENTKYVAKFLQEFSYTSICGPKLMH